MPPKRILQDVRSRVHSLLKQLVPTGSAKYHLDLLKSFNIAITVWQCAYLDPNSQKDVWIRCACNTFESLVHLQQMPGHLMLRIIQAMDTWKLVSNTQGILWTVFVTACMYRLCLLLHISRIGLIYILQNHTTQSLDSLLLMCKNPGFQNNKSMDDVGFEWWLQEQQIWSYDLVQARNQYEVWKREQFAILLDYWQKQNSYLPLAIDLIWQIQMRESFQRAESSWKECMMFASLAKIQRVKKTTSACYVLIFLQNLTRRYYQRVQKRQIVMFQSHMSHCYKRHKQRHKQQLIHTFRSHLAQCYHQCKQTYKQRCQQQFKRHMKECYAACRTRHKNLRKQFYKVSFAVLFVRRIIRNKHRNFFARQVNTVLALQRWILRARKEVQRQHIKEERKIREQERKRLQKEQKQKMQQEQLHKQELQIITPIVSYWQYLVRRTKFVQHFLKDETKFCQLILQRVKHKRVLFFSENPQGIRCMSWLHKLRGLLQQLLRVATVVLRELGTKCKGMDKAFGAYIENFASAICPYYSYNRIRSLSVTVESLTHRYRYLEMPGFYQSLKYWIDANPILHPYASCMSVLSHVPNVVKEFRLTLVRYPHIPLERVFKSLNTMDILDDEFRSFEKNHTKLKMLWMMEPELLQTVIEAWLSRQGSGDGGCQQDLFQLITGLQQDVFLNLASEKPISNTKTKNKKQKQNFVLKKYTQQEEKKTESVENED